MSKTADTVRVKCLAPLAARPDHIDARVLDDLVRRALVPAIWPPDPATGWMGAGPLPAPSRVQPSGSQ